MSEEILRLKYAELTLLPQTPLAEFKGSYF